MPAGYLLYVGARFFAQILDQPRREAFEKKLRAQNLSLVERSKATASFTTDTPTLIDELLDSVVADIPNYMRSIVAGEGPAFEILERFHTQMARAQKDGCDEVHVLAHSLGTVIAFHALSGLGLPRPARPCPPRGASSPSAARSRRSASSGRGPFARRKPSTDPDFPMD